MSVQDEITRIQNGKEDLLNAIAEYGVEVSSDTPIEQTGDKVRAIGGSAFAKLNEANTFSQNNEFLGSLTLPNSPNNPETETVTDTYTTRKTAKADTTNLTVVNGSTAIIDEINGSTVSHDSSIQNQPNFIGLKNAKIKGIKSTGKNLFDINNPTIVARHINDFTQNAIKIENGIIYNGGVYGSNRGTEICIPVKKNTNYTFSFNATIDESKNPNRYAQVSGLSGFNENNIHSGITALANEILVKNGANTLTVNSKDWDYICIAFWTNNKYAMAITNFQIEEGNIATEFSDYVEDLFTFQKSYELAQWDSFNPKKCEIARATNKIVLDGTENWALSGNLFYISLSVKNKNGRVGIATPYNYSYYSGNGVFVDDKYLFATQTLTGSFNKDIEAWKAHLSELYAEGNPLTIAFEVGTPTIEKIENNPFGYTVYENGTETIIGNENEEYGAIPTITQTYYIQKDEKETVAKEYINNGLAKKVDTVIYEVEKKAYQKKDELATAILDMVYPIGAVYISVRPESPRATIGGTWELLAAGRTLWTTIAEDEGGRDIPAGLPNIEGSFTVKNTDIPNSILTGVSGAFTKASTSSTARVLYDRSEEQKTEQVSFNARNSNSIYGRSSTVQPPAIAVFMWKRIG